MSVAKNLTGTYRKPKDKSLKEAVTELSLSQHKNVFYHEHIEIATSKCFSGSIDASSFSDGNSCRLESVSFIVWPNKPKCYEIDYVVEVHFSDDDDSEDSEILDTLVHTVALWNCEQNILHVKSRLNYDENNDDISELLKYFKNPPKLVSESIFMCTLAY